MTESGLDGLLLFLPFHCFQVCTWAAAERSLAAQDDSLQLLRPAAGRHAEDAGKKFDHRIGKWHVVFFVELENVRRLHFLGHQEKSHVADNFARWRDLHDVAEELVDLGIHFFGFAPTMTEANGGSLF